MFETSSGSFHDRLLGKARTCWCRVSHGVFSVLVRASISLVMYLSGFGLRFWCHTFVAFWCMFFGLFFAPVVGSSVGLSDLWLAGATTSQKSALRFSKHRTEIRRVLDRVGVVGVTASSFTASRTLRPKMLRALKFVCPRTTRPRIGPQKLQISQPAANQKLRIRNYQKLSETSVPVRSHIASWLS